MLIYPVKYTQQDICNGHLKPHFNFYREQNSNYFNFKIGCGPAALKSVPNLALQLLKLVLSGTIIYY